MTYCVLLKRRLPEVAHLDSVSAALLKVCMTPVTRSAGLQNASLPSERSLILCLGDLVVDVERAALSQPVRMLRCRPANA